MVRPRPDRILDYREFPVLYVDDEPENLRIFELTFRREFSIVTADSGNEGLEVINRQPVALVLSVTLAPVLASRVGETPPPRLARWARARYTKLLKAVLSAGPGPLLLAALVLALGLRVLGDVGYEDLFAGSRAGVIQVGLSLPAGDRVEAADRFAAQVEERVLALGLHESELALVGEALNAAKVGLLAGSAVAAMVGMAILVTVLRPNDG